MANSSESSSVMNKNQIREKLDVLAKELSILQDEYNSLEDTDREYKYKEDLVRMHELKASILKSIDEYNALANNHDLEVIDLHEERPDDWYGSSNCEWESSSNNC
ncbi:MAG TPA: hypothetical protein VKN14_05580 [Flavobacteriaceae bacterium]|nr:hypothetical protein [Flavobacteriaceae bacterium]